MRAPATLAALPSTRAISDRDVFNVAQPIRSIHPSSFILSFVRGEEGETEEATLATAFSEKEGFARSTCAGQPEVLPMFASQMPDI